MNERIKELIKSLGIIPEDEHYEVAELIIEECVGVCMNVNNDLPRTEPLVAASIKKHFGVK